ncbi:2823_t:CDS:2 [Ambispora gerdemannii]|uniref:2823_t:CDS:1 n=1 Tax=Ambispora gerdemannii TaxID=144530 RepID=A0A9N9G323_9GLOM|nr:2823_t:CDS:2 [Ambispora gerdemannii]
MAIFKLTYNSTTRQLIIPGCASWAAIQSKIRTIFEIPNDKSIYISLVDQETHTLRVIESVSELKKAVKSKLGGGDVKLLNLSVTTEMPDETEGIKDDEFVEKSEESKSNKNEQDQKGHRPGVMRRIATFGIPQCNRNPQNNDILRLHKIRFSIHRLHVTLVTFIIHPTEKFLGDDKSVATDYCCAGDGVLRHLVLGDFYCYS